MKAKTTLAALAIAAMLGAAYAQTTKPAPKTEVHKSCYVDANKNSTCDKYEAKRCKIGDGKCILDANGKVKNQKPQQK